MSNVRPTITVGLVTYNRSHLLPRAIDSVLRQSFSDWELIISDDNSRDETRAVAEKYVLFDNRIKYIKRTGIGMTSNFMKTLQECHSQYFMWLCDDDYISETYLSECVEFLKSDSTYTLACGETKFMSDGLINEEREYLEINQENPSQRVMSYFRQVGSNILLYGVMRTNEVRDLIYPDTFGADLLWSAQIMFCGKAKILADCFIFYSTQGISQHTQQLQEYYPTTRNKKNNPYRILRKEACDLILDEHTVFGSIPLWQRWKLTIGVWITIRERFCMPSFEARIRGALKVRSRLRKLWIR